MRRTHIAPVVASLATLVAALSGCASDGICDGPALTDALAHAAAGSSVVVGSCTVQGRFTVPAGVTLRGQGPDRSTIASPGTALEIGGAGATIASLRVQHRSGHGIVAISTDAVTIRDVAIVSSLGRAGIGLSSVGTATLTNVSMTGPVTSANVNSLGNAPTAMQTALYGLAMVSVGTATLSHVSASGYGVGGVAARDSSVTWSDGTVTGNLGLGVWFAAGSATLTRVTIRNTLRGFRLHASWGLATGEMATVHTVDCEVADTEDGAGMLHDTGSVIHEGLHASGHAGGAIVAQSTSSLALSGGMIVDNDFAGLIAIGATDTSVTDSMIASTHIAMVSASWGSMPVGDGIQLVHPLGATLVRQTTLATNERAGMLVDLGGGTTMGLTCDAVDVMASDATSLGVVTQNGTELASWDVGVARNAVATANDTSFTGGLGIVSIISPTDTPAGTGLDGIISPTD